MKKYYESKYVKNDHIKKRKSRNMQCRKAKIYIAYQKIKKNIKNEEKY